VCREGLGHVVPLPKVWKNAGVSIDYATKQIVFENHKGEAKSRLPLPPMKFVTFDGLETETCGAWSDRMRRRSSSVGAGPKRSDGGSGYSQR